MSKDSADQPKSADAYNNNSNLANTTAKATTEGTSSSSVAKKPKSSKSAGKLDDQSKKESPASAANIPDKALANKKESKKSEGDKREALNTSSVSKKALNNKMAKVNSADELSCDSFISNSSDEGSDNEKEISNIFNSGSFSRASSCYSTAANAKRLASRRRSHEKQKLVGSLKLHREYNNQAETIDLNTEKVNE